MNNSELINCMMEYFSGDPKRIQHFMKVYFFAKMIGEEEKIPQESQKILEMAAITHDIGIKMAEQKYGRCDGKLQETEGPKEAEAMLKKLGVCEAAINRVMYLIGHHHTYTDIEGADYQILVEADFLVNMYEDGMSKEAVYRVYEKIFRTKSGKKLCRTIYKF